MSVVAGIEFRCGVGGMEQAMDFLDVFALVVLLVLAATTIGVWVGLGMLPGRIARSRNHPQAEAINVCGWFGVITLGLLLPIAFIWAYTRSGGRAESDRSVDEADGGRPR